MVNEPDVRPETNTTPSEFDWSVIEARLGALFLPDDGWEADPEVLKALDSLPDPHRQKKRATVLALVGAKLAGLPEEGVFGRADTCSRNIWYGKWRKDELISSALESVLAIGETWRSKDELRALQTASRFLALGTPAAAARLVAMIGDQDSSQARLASQAILDRADFSTASKSSSLHGEMDDLLDDEEQAAVEAALREAADRRK